MTDRVKVVAESQVLIITPQVWLETNFLQLWNWLVICSENSCDGRVVKALDSKSNGVSPRRFKSCSQRISGPLDQKDTHLLWTDCVCWEITALDFQTKLLTDRAFKAISHSRWVKSHQNSRFSKCPSQTKRSVKITGHDRDKHSCDGRVVKALDSKSNGVSPRRFKSCSQRISGTLYL